MPISLIGNNMKDKNDFSDAIQATIAFFTDIIEHSNENPRKILVRMRERRIANGKSTNPYPIVSKDDINHFSEALSVKLTAYFKLFDEASLIMDYQPMWMLQEIIEESKIEDKRNFLFNARFPSKMKLMIFHDHIELKLDGDQMPIAWHNKFFLGDDNNIK
jgi:hypothetical protein